MAEDGVAEPALAKRKAARQLGLPDNAPLPDDAAVTAELRLYQALYQREEHPAHLLRLRREAVRLMALLEAFRPCLSGAVLEGTAGAHSAIDLILFADSAKEVEIFLLNHGICFVSETPRHDHAEAALRLTTPDAEANLLVFPPQLERHRFHHRNGRPRERARLAEVLAMLEPPACA
jgi:hypothetical protein